MISTKKHFEEYKDYFVKNATKIYDSLDDASSDFAEKFNVSKDDARERIENNTNADWIVSPSGKVYMLR